MLMFDPDAERTPEEIIQRTWDRWSPERKARVLAVAEAMGGTWFDVLCEGLERYVDMANDPIEGPRIQAQWDFQELPFGPDPRLSQDGAR